MAVEEDGGEDEADEEENEQDDQTRPRNDVTATRMTSSTWQQLIYRNMTSLTGSDVASCPVSRHTEAR